MRFLKLMGLIIKKLKVVIFGEQIFQEYNGNMISVMVNIQEKKKTIN